MLQLIGVCLIVWGLTFYAFYAEKQGVYHLNKGPWEH